MTSQPDSLPYQYAPLPDKRSIRLLEVESLDDKGLLTCSIYTILSISDNQTEYRCVSYTWGNPYRDEDIPYNDIQHTINCGTGSLSVGLNLYRALCGLFKLPGGRAKNLWVDAICINQSDEKERNPQVAMMHDIYKCAGKVIPFLGPRDADSDVALEVIRILEANEQVNPWSPNVLRGTSFQESLDVDAVGTLPVSARQWCACRNFLRRSYFQRLWIFQEMVLAQELDAVCGEQTVSWSGLLRMSEAWISVGISIIDRDMTLAERLQCLNPPLTVASFIRLYGRNLTALVERISCSFPYKLSSQRDRYIRHGHLREWADGSIVAYYNRNDYLCFDPRDRIYAYIGVCDLKNVTPDYSNTVAEVYTTFWSDCLLHSGDVNLLMNVEDASSRQDRKSLKIHGQEEYELPSWVPDFHSKMVPPSLWTYNPYFTASKGLRFGTEMKINNECLSMNGWQLDRIEELGECDEESLIHHGIPNLLKLATSLPKTYPTGGDSLDALWRTTAILVHGTKYPAEDSQRQLFRLWVKGLLCESRVNLHLRNSHNDGQLELLKSLPSDIFPSSEEIELQKDEIVASDGNMASQADSFGTIAFAKMRIFRTKMNFVGKGHQSMMVGDEVWLVPGAEVPFILRRCGADTWKFVGQAYVHGIMHGDGADEKNTAEPIRLNIV